VGILPDVHWNGGTKAGKKTALDTFIDKANSEGWDCVIQVGDLVSTGSFSDDLTAVQNATDYIENQGGSEGSGLDMPIHYQLGNHEYKNQNGGSMGDIYSELFGGSSLSDTCETAEYGGWKVVSLNSAYSTTETNNATTDSRIPDSSDPFDAISWLDSELDTDKPVIIFTHYPLDNGPGGAYFYTANAYQALKTIAKHDNLAASIFGHVHGHDDYDVGRQNVGPFGNVHYCAGHISGGESVYTYGDPPHEHLFAWGDFYHPRRYSINNNLNTLDRHNYATDSVGEGGFWHPRFAMRGGGEDRLDDLSALTPLVTDKTESGDFSQTGYRRELRLSTGTTAGSAVRTQFERLNTPLPRWEVLESFSVHATPSVVSESNQYLGRVGRGEVPYKGTTDANWYGFKIENGDLYGEALSSSGATSTTSSIMSVGQGDELFLSAMLFSPHLGRFYAKNGNGGDWMAADLTSNLPTGGKKNRWHLSASLENLGVAENCQLDLYDYKFWKRGN
jgi:predicted phosphodiesterase